MSTQQKVAVPPIAWIASIAFIVGMFLWSHGVSEQLLWARIPGMVLLSAAFGIVAIMAARR